jgi:hypothetical protein
MSDALAPNQAKAASSRLALGRSGATEVSARQRDQRRLGGTVAGGATARILLANEPRLYRDVIAGALRAVRPHLEVIVVEPEDLDREVVRLAPDLVLCSQLTEVVETRPLAWVVLYPDMEMRAVIAIAGQRHTVDADFPFTSLLSVIAEVECHIA